jgi:hypothetical protein
MTFWETLGAIIAAQIPLFLINRYFFDKVIKKGLDKVEKHSISFIKNLWRKNDTAA